MCSTLGIGPGDEVVLPSLTFWASAAAILHHNAIPIFVDIDPSQIENKISERTKAILPVHIHRMPADMDAVLQISDQYNLKVIEDGAQLHGMD